MARKWIFAIVVFGIFSLSAGAEVCGGSTGHGPTEPGFDGMLASIRVRLRACRECLPYYPGGRVDDDVLSLEPRLDQNVVFGDGSSVIDGVFHPSSGGNLAADVVCAVAANGDAPVPDIGECEYFAACLGF